MPSVRFPEPGAVAPAFSRAKRVPRKSPAGFYVVKCGGCGFSPLRDDESDERSEINHMLTCDSCGRRVCIACMGDKAECCQSCSAERLRVELRGALA